MNYPSKILERAVEEISQLPGIGKQTALRLALHMLRTPKSRTEFLSTALHQLVNKIEYCQICYTISNQEVCDICSNVTRNRDTICLVEDVRDVMAIENTGQYRGVYHVLGGRISPLEGIGPEELNVEKLVNRCDNEEVKEIIFALSSTMEGDTTMFYMYRTLKKHDIVFSAIARGVGIGDELQYTDELTLANSIENRVLYKDSF